MCSNKISTVAGYHVMLATLLLMLVFPFVRISARINNRAEIRTKGNTNIKNSLIRICDTEKKRKDKVRRIKSTKTQPYRSFWNA